MRRALVSTLVLAAAAAGAVPVLAAPGSPVDNGQAAGISLSAKLPSGDTLDLDITAAELSAGPRLVVNASRCDDDGQCVYRTYAGPLPEGALTIDTSAPTARLATTLDGRSLDIRWAPAAQGGYTVGSGTIQGGDQATFGNEYAGTSADTAVAYAGTSCQGTGGVGNAVVLDSGAATGGSAASPLTALHLPDGITLRC